MPRNESMLSCKLSLENISPRTDCVFHVGLVGHRSTMIQMFFVLFCPDDFVLIIFWLPIRITTSNSVNQSAFAAKRLAVVRNQKSNGNHFKTTLQNKTPTRLYRLHLLNRANIMHPSPRKFAWRIFTVLFVFSCFWGDRRTSGGALATCSSFYWSGPRLKLPTSLRCWKGKSVQTQAPSVDRTLHRTLRQMPLSALLGLIKPRDDAFGALLEQEIEVLRCRLGWTWSSERSRNELAQGLQCRRAVCAAECGSICQYIFEAATTCALKFQLVGSGRFQLTCEYPFVFIHFQNGKTMISIEFVPPGCSFRLVAMASRCSNDSHWLNQ